MDLNYSQYKLRCSLFGHSKDVRAVCVTNYPDGYIVSGSRDKSGKIWKPNEGDQEFTAVQTLNGHHHFVSSISTLPPDDTYQLGLILTGSQDGVIRAFDINSAAREADPVWELHGHKGTVCALATGKHGIIVSGSWDNTVRVWEEKQCVATLDEHGSTIWAVAILPGHNMQILSGCAEKTIKLWDQGKCTVTFTGHSDCVRGLAALSPNDFLSCSNDATVRHWQTNGECLNVYYGHSNYIYSIAILPNGQDFITCGEDKTLRVWESGECKQIIHLPCTSIWDVACLPNDDIIAGGSDGVIRVFTKNPQRQAPPDQLKAFDEAVAGSTISALGELGGIKLAQLPGLEGLSKDGTKAGQTKMIRDGEKVYCYSWNAIQKEWIKVGDVVGASGGTQSSSGKQLHNGKEYDYVFSVDIDEVAPKLKLPYNISEDPWFAAQRFIHENNLSQVYLDQIANFIVTNTKGITLGTTANEFQDPFTGGNRYVPGSADANSPNTTGQDPFTGGNRYVPQTAPSALSNAASGYNFVGSIHIPHTTYIRFDQANIPVIQGKLVEFNSKSSGDGQCTLTDAELANVIKLAEDNSSPDAQALETLQKILLWPHGIIFPCLDILRLAVRNELVFSSLCPQASGEFLPFITSFLKPDVAAPNQFLTLRALSNLFVHDHGRDLMFHSYEQIIHKILELVPSKNKNVEIAVATLFLNYSVAMKSLVETEIKIQFVSAVVTTVEKFTDNEAMYRALVALGTLLWNDPQAVALAHSLDILLFLKQIKTSSATEKVKDCASQIQSFMS